ncbi:MAG: bifunctional precorrin-2 dehydrogenase/sirohydrochlorin ferrochelatase [Planctomycetota bacterium]|nr:bifunctional precorrin-2 dehydrogenase/sirohydrochlorin ferrochelatase [Planctomycetota bacterium]
MPEPRFTYPIFLGLEGRRALVVGGGKVAFRKAQTLADAGAEVCVVAPEFEAEFRRDGRFECIGEPYTARHIQGAFLVVAATDDEAVNAQVAADARAAGVLVNVVDRPALCDFIVPSVVDRGRLLIAISTGGAAPSLSRKTRERFEKEFGPEYATLLDALAEVRYRYKSSDLPEATRRKLFERLTEADIVAAAREGKAALAKAIEAAIQQVLA